MLKVSTLLVCFTSFVLAPSSVAVADDASGYTIGTVAPPKADRDYLTHLAHLEETRCGARSSVLPKRNVVARYEGHLETVTIR